MARLIAPAGVTSFSHGGHSFEIADDGTLEVGDSAVTAAVSHGFTEIAADAVVSPSEIVSVKRESILKVLEGMGVAANPNMVSDKLAAAFDAAAARVKKAAAPAPKDDKGGDNKDSKPQGDNK